MAIKRSKPRKRRNTTSNQPNSKAAYVVLSGILLVGAAGWYHSTFEKDIGQNKLVSTANKTIAIPQKKPENTSNKTTLPAIPLPKAVIPSVLSASKESFSKQIAQNPVSLVPYKADKHLPPKAQFGANNAAGIIYAKTTIAIYEKNDSRSKRVAMLKPGQEMRSYEHLGTWHRIVVPTTDIIGWAKDDDIILNVNDSAKTGNSAKSVDKNITSSINNN